MTDRDRTTGAHDRAGLDEGLELDAAEVRVADPSVPGGVRTILHPVSLRLTERRVAVVGPNGSGKSTLARLLNGLVLPTSGSVRVRGLDTRRDGARVRSVVGFVFSDPDAQLVMPTPLEDVLLSLRRHERDRARRETRAREVLARFGLADRADVSVHALSGGQKQLLALAGVLATEPEVLVCDEPTTLLDLRWTAHVDALLAGLPQQVVHVTHDLAAAATADRLLVVEDGHVVHDGDPAAGIAAYRERMLASAHALATGHAGAASAAGDGQVDVRSTTTAGPA
ncbi:biotin transport system ATP-binding protein [Flavimobilis soli]|uniref:Biotin transport system ATP-binding protein n=1 Tax=Flavimobilis soli TaxID=442709 RepID=A0A2A9E9Q9_9MICO|nr:biotin transport system ATP-binding protein [Flavimobilis soli]